MVAMRSLFLGSALLAGAAINNVEAAVAKEAQLVDKVDKLPRLENTDLLDLLDAELDESLFTNNNAGEKIQRNLQMEGEEMTMSPTPAPTSAQRGGVDMPSAAPTASVDMSSAAPTASDRGMTSGPTSAGMTSAPTVAGSAPNVTPAPTPASGVWRPLPSAATAFAAVLLAALSGAAMVA